MLYKIVAIDTLHGKRSLKNKNQGCYIHKHHDIYIFFLICKNNSHFYDIDGGAVLAVTSAALLLCIAFMLSHLKILGCYHN